MNHSASPGRPAHNTLAARRDLLLATALDLFIAHGYADVSLAAIAGAAHVAVRTIYVKFGGKAGLLRALISTESQRHRAQLDALPVGSNIPQQLELLAVHLVRRISDERVMQLHAIVMAEGDHDARDAWRDAGPGQLAAVLAALFSRAEAQPLFDSGLTVQDLCTHFFHCLGGHSNTGYKMTQAAPDIQVQRGLRLFLRGVIRA